MEAGQISQEKTQRKKQNQAEIDKNKQTNKKLRIPKSKTFPEKFE